MSLSHTEVDTVRILLADDHPGVRSGIRRLLEYEPELTIVGEAKDGREALRLAQQLKPDILLLDIEMPVMSGFEVARWLRDQNSEIRILAISSHNYEGYILEMLKCGISGYLVKEEAADLLIEAITEIWQGENRWLSSRIRTKLLEYI